MGGIRGFIPASMLDWPGKLAAVLFIGGCNLRCPFCHNPSLVLESPELPILNWEDLHSHLFRKRGWLDGVCVTGGEPTLWGELQGFLRTLRSMGLAIKLDTNGTLPERLSSLIGEGLLDAVSMDLKTSPRKYGSATGNGTSFDRIAESMELLLDSRLEVEFRCTVVPGLVELEDLLDLASFLRGRAGITLQQFRPRETLHPKYRELQPYEDDLLREWSRCLSELLPVRLRGLSAQVTSEMREKVV